VANYNWDTLGMKMPDRHRNENVDISDYKHAVKWIREHVTRKFGIVISKSIYDPELDIWMFYNAQGDIITKLERSLMDRLNVVLAGIHYLKVTQATDPDSALSAVSKITDSPQEPIEPEVTPPTDTYKDEEEGPPFKLY
jgi:hypothetical protein